MNLYEIELFLTLCKTLHFQKASALCNISPSAFSRAINRIEEEAGKKLFERSNRSVSLTPAGIVFKEYAEKMIRLWKESKTAMSINDGNLIGELSIYCSVTAVYGILPDILEKFRNEYPSVHIRLRTGDAESALRMLRQDETDVAIAALPGTLPTDIDYIPVTETPLVWIQSAKNRFVTGDGVNWEQTPLILPKQGIARNSFDQWSRENLIKPMIYAEVTGNEAIIAITHLGFGIGLVPKLVLEKSPVADTIEPIPFEPPLSTYSIAICIKKKNIESSIIKAFRETSGTFSTETPV